LRREARLEDPGPRLGRHARTRVAHDDADVTLPIRDVHVDRALRPALGRVEGVLDQVADDGGQVGARSGGRAQPTLRRDVERYPALHGHARLPNPAAPDPGCAGVSRPRATAVRAWSG